MLGAFFIIVAKKSCKTFSIIGVTAFVKDELPLIEIELYLLFLLKYI
jgi:hypothetical protein